MKGETKNQNGGFLKLIIFIIIALLLLKFFNISISDAVNWFKSFFSSVLK